MIYTICPKCGNIVTWEIRVSNRQAVKCLKCGEKVRQLVSSTMLNAELIASQIRRDK